MNVPNTLIVDGTEMTVVRFGATRFGFTELFLGHGSVPEQAHCLPSSWLAEGRGTSCAVNGHVYRMPAHKPVNHPAE